MGSVSVFVLWFCVLCCGMADIVIYESASRCKQLINEVFQSGLYAHTLTNTNASTDLTVDEKCI